MSSKSRTHEGTTEEEPKVGVDPNDVDEATPDQCTVADLYDLDVDSDQDDVDGELLELAEKRDDPLVEMLVRRVVELEERVDEIREDQEQTHDIATSAVGKAQTNERRIDDVEEHAEETREISRSAIAKANQVDADVDHQEDAEELPHGVKPSTSPVDFYSNCRDENVREMFVEDSNRANTYRAIRVAQRWEEFANRKNTGDVVFFERGDVQDALVAEMGEKPHRETVSRVWEKMKDMGGDDLVEKRIAGTNKQESRHVLEMDVETAHGLLEGRYLGLDLIDEATKGVTPVVTGESGQPA